jgi:F0F1-type ATP synthase assembly protein I
MEGLIIAVIIGLVTTIFNRVKESSSEENRPKPKPISAGNPSQTYREEPRTKREPLREEPVYTLQTQFEDNKKNIESKYAQLKKQESDYKDQVKMQRSKVNSIKDKKKSQYSIDFENQDDIVKGFIFSEVFGQPRAKKQHHRK